MNRELLIKNIIETILEPEGFSYRGRSQGISEFLRKVKNTKGETIRQIVSLQDSEYEKKVFLNLNSTYSGHGWYRIKDFIPEYKQEALYFENEEEYKEVIEKYAIILSEYGMPLLEKIKESQILDCFIDEDSEKLFYEHEKLVENLLTREKITVEQFNVEKVAEFIERKILEVKEEPFDKVRKLILELSALFGTVANQYHACHWILDEYLALNCLLEFPELKNLKGRRSNMCVMTTLWIGWKTKRVNYEGIKNDLLYEYRYCTQEKGAICDSSFSELE